MGIVEGEMRGGKSESWFDGVGVYYLVSASMGIEELFNNRRHFQEKVRENVQEALDKFGCKSPLLFPRVSF